MWKSFRIAFTAMAVPFIFVTIAMAQTPMPRCAPHDTMHDILAKRYQEAVRVEATSRDTLIEIYVSAKGTWTVVATNTQGVSCIQGDGLNWSEVDDHLAPLDAAA